MNQMYEIRWIKACLASAFNCAFREQKNNIQLLQYNFRVRNSVYTVLLKTRISLGHAVLLRAHRGVAKVLEEAYLQNQGMQLANPPIESVFPSSPFPFRHPHSGFNGLVGSQERSVLLCPVGTNLQSPGQRKPAVTHR